MERLTSVSYHSGKSKPCKHFAIGSASVLRQGLRPTIVQCVAVCKSIQHWIDINKDSHQMLFGLKPDCSMSIQHRFDISKRTAVIFRPPSDISNQSPTSVQLLGPNTDVDPTAKCLQGGTILSITNKWSKWSTKRKYSSKQLQGHKHYSYYSR